MPMLEKSDGGGMEEGDRVIFPSGKKLLVYMAHGWLDKLALVANLVIRLSIKSCGVGIPSPPAAKSRKTLARENVFLLGNR